MVKCGSLLSKCFVCLFPKINVTSNHPLMLVAASFSGSSLIDRLSFPTTLQNLLSDSTTVCFRDKVISVTGTHYGMLFRDSHVTDSFDNDDTSSANCCWDMQPDTKREARNKNGVKSCEKHTRIRVEDAFILFAGSKTFRWSWRFVFVASTFHDLSCDR